MVIFMQKKTYAVFGLGRYGMAAAKELVKNGMDVIAVDINERIVDDTVGILPICKCADITDPEVVSQLGISNVDVVIIAMASNLEASVMAVTLCKEAGVKTVITKCANEMHQRILKRVGSDIVVFPENESGIRLAKNLLTSGFIDVLSLSDELSIVELNVKEDWIGKNLIELNLRKKYSINAVAIRKGEKVEVPVNPEEPLDKDTTLIAIVNTAKMKNLK